MVYPKISPDFDSEFLDRLLRAIFTEVELTNCASQRSLKILPRSKLQFAKGIFYEIVYHTIEH